MRRVLSDAQLQRLADHKYSSGGRSVLEVVFQPFWSWLVTKMPLWLAPNLMTISGLIVNIASSLLVVFYSPRAIDPAPWWSYILCAIGIFVYQTLDALDGKQARRTGSSNSLGELFDHGCDAFSTVVIALAVVCSLLLGNFPVMLFVTCFSGLVAYYCAHWNAYITGTLPVNGFDVTETQVSIMIIHTISGILGPNVWLTKIPKIEIEINVVASIFVEMTLLYVTLKALLVIQQGGQGKNGSTVANTSVVSPGMPMFFLLFVACTLFLHSPSHLFHNNPCLFVLTFGMSACKITINLVIAHVSKSPMVLMDSTLLGPLVLLMNLYFRSIFNEYYLMLATLAFSTVDVLYSVQSTCSQVCRHMKINCFTITPKPAPQ